MKKSIYKIVTILLVVIILMEICGNCISMATETNNNNNNSTEEKSDNISVKEGKLYINNELAKNKKYDTTSDKESVLNYTFDEVNLEDGIAANTVTIPYSDLHTTSYKYDPETKRYTRYARGEKQTEMQTGEAITTKNIIVTFAKNTPLKDNENKDRQDLDDVGTNDGYYITNGKAIKIKCIKNTRSSQTIYKDLQGNEIKVNDGNTFFNICPIDSNVTFE